MIIHLAINSYLNSEKLRNSLLKSTKCEMQIAMPIIKCEHSYAEMV